MEKDKFEEAKNGRCWCEISNTIKDIKYYADLCVAIKNHIGEDPQKHPTNMGFMKKMVEIIHDISGKLLVGKDQN
ncbi:MAG: hypothetical protein Nk1A_1190 [Endomicrobiia bacterium]|nr:MAG: hypothetical protein Nk1A_1190 [Endomicrobiia bacterium]